MMFFLYIYIYTLWLNVLNTMEMFKMMTVGIKAVRVQEHSFLEQLTDHTVTHYDNVVAYLLLRPC